MEEAYISLFQPLILNVFGLFFNDINILLILLIRVCFIHIIYEIVNAQ